MECEAKDAEIEALQKALQQQNANADAVSVDSADGLTNGDTGQCPRSYPIRSIDSAGKWKLAEARGRICFAEKVDKQLKGAVWLPYKSGSKKRGWKKYFLVLSAEKVLVFESESDRQMGNPWLVLDVE